MQRLEFSGPLCAPLSGGAVGLFERWARKSVLWKTPALQSITKIQREDPQRGENERHWGAVHQEDGPAWRSWRKRSVRRREDTGIKERKKGTTGKETKRQEQNGKETVKRTTTKSRQCPCLAMVWFVWRCSQFRVEGSPPPRQDKIETKSLPSSSTLLLVPFWDLPVHSQFFPHPKLTSVPLPFVRLTISTICCIETNVWAPHKKHPTKNDDEHSLSQSTCVFSNQRSTFCCRHPFKLFLSLLPLPYPFPAFSSSCPRVFTFSLVFPWFHLSFFFSMFPSLFSLFSLFSTFSHYFLLVTFF